VSLKGFKVLSSLPDPTVITDLAARDAIAAVGRPWKIKHLATDMVLLLVPPGEFKMGSAPQESWRNDDEKQHHRVIRKPFYLGVTPVTVTEWAAVMGGARPDKNHYMRPVENLSWNDCKAFLAQAGGEMRLPTEAEWEYACRAGTRTPFAFGASVNPSHVHYGGGSFDTPYASTDCGQFPANPWGFHDMHGNIWEWCEDAYGPYPDRGTEEAEQVGDGSGARVVRGGCWYFIAGSCRSASRGHLAPAFANDFFGLRVARSLID
jgi:formylglycine-generating enzyme required for sulfatase activity